MAVAVVVLGVAAAIGYFVNDLLGSFIGMAIGFVPSFIVGRCNAVSDQETKIRKGLRRNQGLSVLR